MPTTVAGTNITYSDSTVQGTAYLGSRFKSFVSSGTFTIPTGISALKVTIVGGGGGGGQTGTALPSNFLSGGGGGGGGTAIKYFTGLTPGNTLTVTIGAGGTSTVAGGTSSVSSGTQTITTVSATGGAAGASAISAATAVLTPAAGGSGSGGDFNINGGSAALPFYYSSCTFSEIASGAGGGFIDGSTAAIQGQNMFQRAQASIGRFGGVGGGPITNANGNGNAGTGNGTGGGGGLKISTSTNFTGGAGTAGIIVFEW